jgi:uncharacterized protein (AIM24 family)
MVSIMKRLLIALLLSLTFTVSSRAAGHPLILSDYGGGTVAMVAADGKVEWEYKAKNPQDCWKLPNGNFLFCYVAGAKEITSKQEVVWEYKAATNVEVHSCQPLPDGKVMIVECGSSRIIEVDRTGKITKEVKLVTAPTVKMHNQFRGSRKTADGHYWVTFKGEGKVVELDGNGKVLREIPVPGDPHMVRPLPNGNILVACGDAHKLIELDKNLKVVWELNENDIPGNPLRLSSGFQRLPNGNTLVCNWGGHGHVGKQPHFFEITRDKQLVWSFNDFPRFKTINQVQLLDVPGDVTKGEILR